MIGGLYNDYKEAKTKREIIERYHYQMDSLAVANRVFILNTRYQVDSASKANHVVLKDDTYSASLDCFSK